MDKYQCQWRPPPVFLVFALLQMPVSLRGSSLKGNSKPTFPLLYLASLFPIKDISAEAALVGQGKPSAVAWWPYFEAETRSRLAFLNGQVTENNVLCSCPYSVPAEQSHLLETSHLTREAFPASERAGETQVATAQTLRTRQSRYFNLDKLILTSTSRCQLRYLLPAADCVEPPPRNR